jgi:TonB family protein
MNNASVNSPALELAETRQLDEDRPAGPKRGGGWTPGRWLAVIALFFATHVALIFLSGEKKEIVPRAIVNIPRLTLANNSDELIALSDPTLFALPHQRDFAAAWLKIPNVLQPTNRYTELPHPLPFSTDGLGAALGQFMQTNFFVISQPPDFKLMLELSVTTLPVGPALAQNSTMQIEGELAQRQLPSQISLTNWPYADVLAPCAVQVLVNEAGDVVSTVLLESSSYKEADDKALELARALRFTPSSQLALGRIIFNWHTVPMTTTTNEPE